MADNRDYMNDKIYEAARVQGAGIPSDIDDDDDGPFLRLTPGNESNVLHIAAECGNHGFISAVLDRVPAALHHELLCQQNLEGETPLHLAAQHGDKGTVEALLFAHDMDAAAPLIIQKKPCWSEIDKQGDTPLHMALRYGHDDIALLLLPRDMKKLVSIVNNLGESPAHLAATYSCTGFLNKVLNADGDGECCVSFSGPFGQTAFHPARKLTRDIMSKLIERRKHMLKVQDKRGKTVLHYAVEEERLSTIETLLKADNSLAYLHDGDVLTPLHKAASMGSISMFRTIVELSPQSIRVREKGHGRTALHLAKMDACSMEECLRNTRMRELINQVDNDGNTPLHLALINYDLLTANNLLDVDDINGKLINKQGYSPLDLCSFDYNITRKLKHLTTSFRPNMEIFYSATVVNVDDLYTYDWAECLKYQGPEGDSILHVAAKDGCMKLINKVTESNDALHSLLLKQNSKGETPLHLAAQHGQLEVVKFILSLCNSTVVAVGNEGENQLMNDENTSTMAFDNGDGNQLADVMPWRIKSVNGDTPVHKAVRNRQNFIALLLLDRDHQLIYFTNNAKESVLYLAADNNCLPVLRKTLLYCADQGITMDSLPISGRNGENLIHAAARKGGLGYLAGLVRPREVVPLKKVDALGKTPLHYAAEINNSSAARWLLKLDKTAAFVYDNEGFTPLMRAASLGYSGATNSILSLCPKCAELRDLRNGRTC